ncbi:uncharacterized protein LOC143240182 isoform X2 [Tachypleus tridentatus]|uniref:uncharacterized protein LOC143240182 isoform X2 n=1 Tax=Tachypleus tridentatus TaxID=6853 RepID=UPI003FD3EB31
MLFTMLTLVALFIFLNYNWAVMTEGFILSRSCFLNHYKTNDVKALSIDSTTLNQAVDKAHEKLTQRQLENSVSGLLKSFTDPNSKILLPQSPKPSEDLCSDTSQNLYCFFFAGNEVVL